MLENLLIMLVILTFLRLVVPAIAAFCLLLLWLLISVLRYDGDLNVVLLVLDLDVFAATLLEPLFGFR